MGTNYYARRIPKENEINKLKTLIDSNSFDGIRKEVEVMYGRFYPLKMADEFSGYVHLGKCSGGWKFLWDPNIYIIRNGHCEYIDNGKGMTSVIFIQEPDTYYYLYQLTKDGIKGFIDRDDIEIYDEYGEKQDKEEFFTMAINWADWRGNEAWDSKTYNEFEKKKNRNWRSYVCSGEYVDMLIKEGYKMIDYDCSDFYSDGLRFATNNDFS